jgi:transcriptional regulator with XRE-family HTH domain
VDQADAHIGSRLRERRVTLGMTQTELGKRLGISFQQLQKYEGGVNRLTASGLWRIAECLDVPVGYFFDGLGSPERGEQDLDRSSLMLTRRIRKLDIHLRQTLAALIVAMTRE